MRLFDVLGPVMIGPSSSHTAGAARIGYTAQKLLGDIPAEADIGLYGSFATTGRGHGTDRALVAGALGLSPQDERLRTSFDIAKERGLQYDFYLTELPDAHENSVKMTFTHPDGSTLDVVGASLGGQRAIEWAVSYPERVRRSAAMHPPQPRYSPRSWQSVRM